LERDDFSSNRHPALSFYWRMIFPENRFPLFGIMRYLIAATCRDRFLDLGFDGLQVEARALLHGREVDGRLAEFGHFLLHEYTAPELENIPVVVSERVGQASALVGIEPKVGDDRPINLHRGAEPARGLISEPVFVVVDPSGGERAFREIPDLMPLRRAF